MKWTKRIIFIIATLIYVVTMGMVVIRRQAEKDSKLEMEKTWLMMKIKKGYILCLVKDGQPIYNFIISDRDANEIKHGRDYSLLQKYKLKGE